MTRLYLALPGARAHLAQSRALLGFDAFIDIVARPLREGSADGAGQAFNLLPDFGAFVSGRAGVSGSVELDERTTKMGGNAPNVAAALGALGVAADCVIPCGPPDPLFAPLAARGRLFSTGEPGLCVALEFLDGKLLLGVNRGVNRLTWAQVTERVGLNTLIGLAEGGGAICFLN
ncbi:MAG: hypothetical protein GX558_02130, partial [Clostridiales bacterium]|nr:hypothetical protein [Clostridiales bacterium]